MLKNICLKILGWLSIDLRANPMAIRALFRKPERFLFESHTQKHFYPSSFWVGVMIALQPKRILLCSICDVCARVFKLTENPTPSFVHPCPFGGVMIALQPKKYTLVFSV